MFKNVAVLALVAMLAVSANAAAVQTTTRVSAGLQFQAGASVTVKNTEADYSRRSTGIVTIPAGIFNYALFTAGSSSAAANATNGNAKVDFLSGSLFQKNSLSIGPLVTPGFPPTVFLGYFSAAASWSGFGDINLSGSASLALTVYGNVEELNAAGAVVDTLHFNATTWALGSVRTSDAAADGSRIRYVTLSTNGLSGSQKISITFVLSEALAVLNVGGATLTPKALESIIEIDNYAYKAATNKLRLNMYAATAAVSGTAKVDTSFYADALIAGSGASAPFFRAAGSALVDGSNVAVTATITRETNTDDLYNLIGDLKGKIEANANLKSALSAGRVSITFPANAALITYDPTVGFEAPNSAARAVPLFVAVVALIAAFLNL